MPTYRLVLYINGRSTYSDAAIENVREVCKRCLEDGCDLEIVDLQECPAYIRDRNILVSPTLDKEAPPPTRRIVGDLSDQQRIVQLLGLRSASGTSMDTGEGTQ